MKDSLKIIPVIELMPATYKKNDYKRPEYSIEYNFNEWDLYNQKCYSDSGLKDIKPIETGRWFFEIEKLTNENLKIILSKIYEERLENDLTLQEILENINDYSPLISGGYILKINNEILNYPGCCCGLEEILQWNGILEDENGNIWNGHDCTSIDFKKEGNDLIFIIDNKSFYTLKNEEFIREIANTNRIVNKFIEKSAPILDEILKIKNGYELAKSMIFKVG